MQPQTLPARDSRRSLNRQLAVPDLERVADFTIEVARQFNAALDRMGLAHVRLFATRRQLTIRYSSPRALRLTAKLMPANHISRALLDYFIETIEAGRTEGDELRGFNRASKRAWRSVRNTAWGRGYQLQWESYEASRDARRAYRAAVEASERSLSLAIRSDPASGDVDANRPHEWYEMQYLPVFLRPG